MLINVDVGSFLVVSCFLTMAYSTVSSPPPKRRLVIYCFLCSSSISLALKHSKVGLNDNDSYHDKNYL